MYPIYKMNDNTEIGKILSSTCLAHPRGIQASTVCLRSLKLLADNKHIYLPTINESLAAVRTSMLFLNGQLPTDKELDNANPCPVFGNIPNNTYGCKTLLHRPEKRLLMEFLLNAILSIFQHKKDTDPTVLLNTDPYINDLLRTLQFYMEFIGFKEVAPMFADYWIPVIDGINSIFGRPIIYDACPNNRSYGCGRIITTVKRDNDPASDKFRIVLFQKSENDDKYTSKNIAIEGGRRTARHRRKQHHTRRKKRTRTNRK